MDREGPSQAVVAAVAGAVAGDVNAVAGAVAGDVNAVAAAQDTQLARRMQQDRPPTWNRTASATANFSISSFNAALASKRAASPDLDDN